MSKKLEIEVFQKRIREVVHKEWDPIGISAYPEAYDEYYSYVPGICRLLEEGVGKDELFQHLWAIETEAMGLKGQKQATDAFAERLIRLYESMLR